MSEAATAVISLVNEFTQEELSHKFKNDISRNVKDFLNWIFHAYHQRLHLKATRACS